MPLVLIVLSVAACAVGMILFVRYAALKRRYALSESREQENTRLPDHDLDAFVARLGRMIRIPTVSWTDCSKRDPSVFRRFQEELVTMYPRVHCTMVREVHGDFGLMYRWQGRNTGKKPVLFLAHYDVVPAEEKGDETWEEPPFSGLVRGGYLWGRGTLDIKGQLAFLMETAERLAAGGWVPDRDIWFAFGGDEEIGGFEGARRMAAVFRERGIEFEFVMDEGGVISKDQMAFLKGRPAALVGLAEKGFVTFKITATGDSGHSSMPVRAGTAVGRLARGVARLEKNPFGSRLDPVVANMLERFVPCVSTGLGLVFANIWLTRPLLKFFFSRNRATDSLIRTTQAVTVIYGGEQENVLPGEAVCLVNHRILPGDTIEMVRNRHGRTLKDDGLTIEDAGNWPANDPISAGSTRDSGFKLIRDTLAATHPEAVVVPYLVNGSTDSKFYRTLTRQILRFCPLVLTPEDVASIHGVNERVSLENLDRGLQFYTRLFLNL